MDDAAKLLRQTREEEKQTDELLSDLAENELNQQAA
jgi:ferritin-like metal-binding protein YciE